MSIVEMQERRARVFERMSGIHAGAERRGTDLSLKQQREWSQLDAEFRVLTDQIEQAQLSEDRDHSAPLEMASLSEGDKDFASFVRGDGRRILDVGLESRDLLAGSGTGANVVPISFVRSLREHIIASSAIRQTNVTVIPGSSGEALRVPKTTAHPTAALVAEGAAIAEADPTFDLVTLDAFKYGWFGQLTREFVEDEAVNVLDYLARVTGRAIGNASGTHFVTGTGTGQPRGVQVAASVGVTGGAGQATSVTSDNLIDLFHSVEAGYRSRGFWFMRDAVAASVRKLKDTTNQYIWQPGLTQGQPDSLFGRPVVVDPNMPAMAANAKSILFGDFSGYYIRDVGSIRFERSDDFAFQNDLVSFRAIFRTDGDLVDTNSIKAYANSAA